MLQQGKILLNSKIKKFTMEWSNSEQFAREVVESPSLKISKTQLGKIMSSLN